VTAMAFVASFALASLLSLLGYQLLKQFLSQKRSTEPDISLAPIVDPPSYPESLRLSSVLQYLPTGIIPIGIGARLQGYKDITEDSDLHPGSMETIGSLTMESKSGDSDYSLEDTNGHFQMVHIT
jgi:hypothetical protein